MSTAAGERAIIHQILARLDLDDLARGMALELREIPYYEPCDRSTLLDRGGPMIRWNLELFLRWLHDGAAPTREDLSELRAMLRVGAARGKRAHEQIVVYNRGVQFLWSTLLGAATDGERGALASYSEIALDYQSIVSQAFSDVYQAQDEAGSNATERRANILLDWLVGPDPVNSEMVSESQYVGFTISDRYRPFVAVIPGGTVTAHAELAQRLRGAGALAVTKLDHVEGLVGEAFAGRQPGADHKILVVTDRAMARADLPTGLEDVRAVAVMARKAALCGPVLVEDFLPQLLLAGSRDIADRLESRVFAPLAEYQADELAATLKTLVANNFDRAATAAALPAHRNTVLYRVNRIEKITGLDLSRSRDLAMIWLATTWRDLSR